MDPVTMLSLAIAALKAGIWLYGWIKSETDSSILKKMKAALAEREARLVVEKAKLAARYAAVDATPDKTGEDLAKTLNEQFGKKP